MPAASPAIAQQPTLTFAPERVRLAMLYLTGLSGAFVFMEPSPYEFVALVTIVVFLFSGLAFRAALIPFVLLLILYNIGFSIAAIPVLGQPKPLTWVLVSWYLALTAVFFAAALGENTEARLRALCHGAIAAGLIAAAAGIIGHFRLAGPLSEMFLRYGRAQGTFVDPNVFGAFLILPAMLCLHGVLNGKLVRNGVILLVIVAGLLLSFSRGAWAQFGMSSALLLGLTFVTSRSPRERGRIALLAVAGLIGLAAVVALLLSFEPVAKMFELRASLDQSYDGGHTGRFGRYALGFDLILDKPFGIGPLQFHKLWGEDPHNAYLNAFISGGWLSGFSYGVLVTVTLVQGLRFAFVETPFRRLYLAVYSAFAGTAAESFVIDSDHWRHYFLLIGMVWGIMAASGPMLRARQALRGPRIAGTGSASPAMAERGAARLAH